MDLSWELFKTFVDNRGFLIQYSDSSDTYFLWSENDNLLIQCRIIKNGGADETDFVNNYKAAANANTALVVGSLTALNGSVDIDCSNLASVGIDIDINTFIGDIYFEASIDNIFYDLIYAVKINDNLSPTNVFENHTVASGDWKLDVTGFQTLRVTALAWVFGSATVTLVGSPYPTSNQNPTLIRSSNDQAILVGQYDMTQSLAVVIASDQSSIPITAVSLPLPIDAAKETKQDIGNASLSSIDIHSANIDTNTTTIATRTPALGQAAMASSVPVAIANNQSSIPVAATLSAETTKVIGTVNVASGQTIGISAGSAVIGHVINDASSAVIGHVITDSGSTTGVTGNVASTVADGANVVLGAKADAKSTATDTTPITMMQVMKQISASVQAPPSQAVTNAGTFAVQATLAAETTKVIGTVNIAASQTVGLVAGTAVIGKVSIDQTTPGTTNLVALAANQSVNNAQVNGVTVSTGNGLAGTGVQRVAISSDNTAFPVNATLQSNTGVDIGKLTANQSVNNAQVNGGTIVASVTGVQDVMPRKRTGATGLAPNYAANHITAKTTTTPTAATAYVSAIAIACSAAGTAWTMVIQNKEGTPKILVPSFTLTVPTTGLPVILQFAEPILMTSGIDIVTGGTTAGTVDVFITYWQ